MSYPPRRVSLVVCLLSAFAASALAQNQTASLTGRVADPSNLGVPGAHIRLTETATSSVRETDAASGGFYRFDLLPPGDYSIQITAKGFRAFNDPKLHLEVARSSTLDVALALGEVSQSVEVTEDVSPLETASVAQGQVISSSAVKEIPLNGRQFLQLALLSPGTNSGGIAVQQNSLRQGEVGGLSVAGQRTNDSAYLLDGVINTDPDYNSLNYVPIVDAIAEFQVQVAQYGAEYGRASGGQINVTTQSGTTQFHGSAWEFLRNDAVDARPFNLTTQSYLPEFRRNQFGGTVGGPLFKKKLFGFFAYEGLRNRQAGANLTTVAVPDALQRTGNFSGELPTVVIYDPSSPVVGGLRTAFPGNIIPNSRLNPSVLAAMAALPTPNSGALFVNTNEVLRQDNDNVSARGDYSITDRMRLFTRYSGAYENASTPATLPNRAGLNNSIPRNVAVGLTHVFSGTKVNDLRLGYSRLNFLFGLPEPTFQVNGTATTLPNFIVGSTNFGGAGPYNATGPGGIAQARDNVYQLWDVFAWQLGRNSLKLGGEFGESQYVRFEYADPLGSLTFTQGYTNATAAAPKATDKSGDALASALLGLPQTAVRTLGPNRIDGRQQNYALFVQDDYRVTTRLTLNLGLRWEVSPSLHDIRNQLASIDFSTVPSTAQIFATGQQGVYSPQLYVCGQGGTPAGCAYTNWTNFSPRLGAAWSLGKTVIRAGAGIYYGTQDGNSLLKLAQSLPTTYNQTITNNAYVPSGTLANVFSTATVGAASITAAAIDPHQGTPYSPQYSFNVQRSLMKNLVLEVGYLGAASVHMEQNVQVNNSNPGTAVKRPYFGLTLAPSVVAAMQYPYTTTTVPVTTINYFPHSAHGSYNALVSRVERKFSAGASLLSAFTWSKALTNAPQYRNAGGITGSENSPPQNSFNLSADKGLAYYNAKFRWVTSGLYQLPFGKGKKMASSGAAAMLLGGWQLAGTLQLQSGFPYTINYKGDPINIGGGSGGILVRPNYVLDSSGNPVNPNLTSDVRTTARWFNTAAFVQPIASFGNVGRNTMIGPNQVNLDTTIGRNFRLTEHQNLLFRVEFFNLANHSNYNLIGRVVNDPTFGIVQNQLPPRQIQFAAKYSF